MEDEIAVDNLEDFSPLKEEGDRNENDERIGVEFSRRSTRNMQGFLGCAYSID